MTKEEILSPHDLYAWECDEGDHVVPYSAAEKAMDEYAKQKAIAFANYIVKDVFKMNSISGSPYVSEDQVYDHFQKKEQQNK